MEVVYTLRLDVALTGPGDLGPVEARVRENFPTGTVSIADGVV